MDSLATLDYQQQLIWASLDDFTPNSALPKFSGGQYGERADVWRQVVIDFICENVKCGLIEATHRPDISVGCDITVLKDMLYFGDKRNNIDATVLWDILYFNGTQKLIKLIQRYGLNGWDHINSDENSEFIGFLKELYKF